MPQEIHLEETRAEHWSNWQYLLVVVPQEIPLEETRAEDQQAKAEPWASACEEAAKKTFAAFVQSQATRPTSRRASALSEHLDDC